ncbi:MAG: hypothetical protein WAJ85_04760 [Candidatus Baltobacteraceae bacterium]
MIAIAALATLVNASSCCGEIERATLSMTQTVPSACPSFVTSGTPAKKRMKGAPVTSGLAEKHSSLCASGTTKTRPGCAIAYLQNDTSRGISSISSPTLALNHCRSASTKLTSAMGVPHVFDASRAIVSNSSSGTVSRMSKARSISKRFISLKLKVVSRSTSVERPSSGLPNAHGLGIGRISATVSRLTKKNRARLTASPVVPRFGRA